MKRAKRRSKKVKPQAVSLAPAPQWDIGAAGPANQIGLREEAATDIDPETGRETPNPNGVRRRRRDSWIERYFAANKLTQAQASAAIRLRMAAEGMRERDPLAAIGEARNRGDGDALAAHVDSRAYYREQWAKVPRLSRPVIERVVIEDKPIWDGNMAQRERHMQRLCDGLDAIA